MLSIHPRSRVLAVGAGLALFLAGVGVGRGTNAPDTEVALIGEAHQHLLDKALSDPDALSLRREAIQGMLGALEDSYAEYLPRASSDRDDPGELVERILGVEESALSESAGIRGTILEEGVAHLRIRLFSPGSGDVVRAEIRRLRLVGARGVVLDLRGNPGGLVDEALSVAGLFLGDRPVFGYRTASGGEGQRTGVGEPVPDLAVVVATDSGTGSASELIAGAIQDAGRGLVVGGRTAGKGTVQRVVTLSDGSALKFTAAEFTTPSGRKVDGVGIRPDITVASGRGDPVLDRARSLLRVSRGR